MNPRLNKARLLVSMGSAPGHTRANMRINNALSSRLNNGPLISVYRRVYASTHIYIFSDSQDSINALESYRTKQRDHGNASVTYSYSDPEKTDLI